MGHTAGACLALVRADIYLSLSQTDLLKYARVIWYCRLYQVEYAIEAISQAGSAVGIKTTGGVVLAAEKLITSKLLEVSKTAEKMYKIDDHVACAVRSRLSFVTS
mgnify:CR=1 FL=1